MSSSQSGSQPPRGMPILSGPPPVTESQNCRQCTKPFNLLLRRAHTCGHCGYEYCSTCLSDGQALMPRRGTQAGPSSSAARTGGTSGSLGGGASGFFAELKEGFRDVVGMDEPAAPGYEVEKVCLPCLGMLQVTSAPIPSLRSLPLKRLKDYLAAYNIPLIGPKEKEDFVQAVVKARNPATGCLSPEAESYYRRKSVPKGGQAPTPAPAVAPRPRPAQSQQPARPPPQQQQYRPTPQSAPQAQYRPPPPASPRPAPAAARPAAPSPRATPAPPKAKTPPPPVPTILSLVSLPKSYLASLSIGTLKAVLYENHVRVDFKQVLEKEELINRVHELIVDERKRLERQRVEEEREANPAPITLHLQPEDGAEGTEVPAEGGEVEKSVPTGPMPEIERGLCVVCQDEEATLAVVDCGHLAMCAHCSDLIMATSQECPLCRTRIVTPQRLIRIYRV